MGPCNLDSELPYARRTHTCHGHAHSGRPSAGSNFNKGNFTTNHDRPSQGDSLRNDVSSEEYGLGHEPVNFLALLHPAARPSYTLFVTRVLRCADQQASIFLQQKLKGASAAERTRIVDAVCTRGAEMMVHRFGNWAVQRCLEAPATVEERRKIVACMRGRVVELATNCYGCHVLQKTLDCEEHLRLLIVEELLNEDPATTLVNKHASHVWSKIMELSWSPTEDGVPSIFSRINEALRGKWAALACHETGSLVVQHAFENLEYEAKDNIVNELLNRGEHVFSDIVRNQWGAYCVQHILEHGATSHRALALDHLIDNLLDCASDEHGLKSVLKALRLGAGFDMPPSILQRIVKRLTEPARGARRPIIVDLALSATGSQLIASVLGMITNEQRSVLYDCIRRHAVTLRGGKTGSKVIWLL
ncbi:ARM repeat-containing protein [Fistulina hepatica ATCC 64428]|uniref:ARM repeat-containing protein n=1 Tax=Fistulina hepatica ATCC 64428 TaxID=1128425 RepID=A0A0D7A0T6_9AGAR|nr:ARM repeat-containing protein [Fistulina hepatica ATCC 64428]